MGFCRQEYWSGLPRPHPGDLPDPGIQPASFMSPALASRFFTTRKHEVMWVGLIWVMSWSEEISLDPDTSGMLGEDPETCRYRGKKAVGRWRWRLELCSYNPGNSQGHQKLGKARKISFLKSSDRRQSADTLISDSLILTSRTVRQ